MQEYKNFVERDTIIFEKDVDTDLYFAIHNAYFSVYAWKLRDKWWYVYVWSSDLYDFKLNLNPVNWLGVGLQLSGKIKTYNWWLEYEYHYRWD